MKRLAFYLLLITGLGSLGVGRAPQPVMGESATTAKEGAEDLCLLPGPNKVTILWVSSSAVSLSWDNVKGATHYRVKTVFANTNIVTQSQIVPTSAIDSTILTTGYNHGGSFFFQVWSMCSNGAESQ